MSRNGNGSSHVFRVIIAGVVLLWVGWVSVTLKGVGEDLALIKYVLKIERAAVRG